MKVEPFGMGWIVKSYVEKVGTSKKIEMLGRMNDRFLEYLGAGNWEGMLGLADEYEEKGMTVMACGMRKKAEEHQSNRRRKA